MNIDTLFEKYNEDPHDLTTVSLLYHELKIRNDSRAEELKIWMDKLVAGRKIQDELSEVHYLNDEETSQDLLKRQVLNLQKRDLISKENRKKYSDRSRSTFIILAILFGFLGIHNFYIKNYGAGFLQLLVYGLLASTGFGLILVYVLIGIEIAFTSKDGEGKLLT